MSLVDDDQISDRWKRQVGAARLTWTKLSPNELLDTNGQQHRLAALVEERYAVTLDDAERQVRSFFQKNRILR